MAQIKAILAEKGGVANAETTDNKVTSLSSSSTDTQYPSAKAVYGGLQRKSNPNLLDNWYFVGGGSQQGGGQFPINQRGQTSYTAQSYCIDRWLDYFDPHTLSVQPHGVNILGGPIQYLENPQKFYGKRLTLSLLTSDGMLLSGSVDIPSSAVASWTRLGTTDSDDGLFCALDESAGGSMYFAMEAISSARTIQAVKLELGDTQTLAHQENGMWVLNEVPNYDEQLYRCMSSTADSNDTYANTPYDALKTSVSNGKSAIASAITDKGVSTSSSASFSTMATNIRAIQTSSIALSSIAVTTAPSKTTYTALETFNSAGMVVTATYSNGATKNVTNDCTWPTTALNAGTTSITITYSEDGITKTTTQAITVNKISVTVPSQSGTLTYKGSSQSPSWNNKPSTSIATYGGTTSGINAGSYTATFTLVSTSNYKWADTTAAARNVTWSISQAANSMALSKTTMTLNASKTSDTLTISGNYDGTVSVSSSDTSVAKVSRSGSTVTVKSVNSTTGSATITVSATGSNYTAASKTCAVTATFFVNPLNTDQLTLGQHDVYFKAYPNIKWCVDHLDGNYVYLGGYNINETTTFGSSTSYSGSTIASECTTYLNNTIPNVADYLENVTVHGVTSKVFIPSKKMFSGTASSGGVDANDPTFDYPSASAANRKACYAALSSSAMWLSSPYSSSSVWSVYGAGDFNYDEPFYSYGFRPEVKVRYK